MVKWTNNGAVLVTGASQRVGLHCVERMLEQGERVVMTYRNTKPSVRQLEANGAVCIPADFSSHESTLGLIETLQKEVGSLRAIVHNASSWPRDVDAGVDHPSVMNEMFQVHMMAPYLLNLHCHDMLIKGAEQWSDIIHITDYVVEEGSDNHIAYAASKAGMDNMTRSFARRYAPEIKVNSIAPSLIMFNDNDSLEYRTNTVNKSSMGIEPGPEIIFQGLSFILDSAYITGRELKLDGGRHIR